MAQPPMYSENPPPYLVNSEKKQKPSEQQPVPQLNYPQPYPQNIQQPTAPLPQGQYPQQYPQNIQQPYNTAPMPQGQHLAPASPVIICQQPVTTGPCIYEKYKSKTSIVLGWIQVVLSIFSIICNSIGIWIQSTAYSYVFAFYIAAGIWVPVLFVFLSGTFAICAGQTKTKCMVITNLVLSIISCVALFVLLGTAAAAVGEADTRYYRYNNRFNGYDSYGMHRAHEISLAMGALLLIISVVLIVCTIWSSALGCALACCDSRSNRTITTSSIQYMNNPAGAASVVVYTNPSPGGMLHTTVAPPSAVQQGVVPVHTPAQQPGMTVTDSVVAYTNLPLGGMPHTTMAPPSAVQQGVVPVHTPYQPAQEPGMTVTGPVTQPTAPQVVYPIQQTTQPPNAESQYQSLTTSPVYTALYDDTVSTQPSENSSECGNVYDYVDPSV